MYQKKLLTMIEETAQNYDKTLNNLASGETDEVRPENKENIDGKFLDFHLTYSIRRTKIKGDSF